MPNDTLPGQADLAYASTLQDSLVQGLQTRDERHDGTVIAAVGELQVRLDAAAALQAEATESAADAAVFRLAAAEAARLAERLLLELLGRNAPRPLPEAGAPSLLALRRQLGDHHLNGTALG